MEKTVTWTKLSYDAWHFYIASTEEGLCYISTPQEEFEDLKKWAAKRLPKYTLKENEQQLYNYKTELFEYLNGQRKNFTFPIRLHGTHFQQSVWQALLAIPFGETVSYSEIATVIDNPKAVRAVGTAVGANPLLFVIPCHRVVGKNGALTGFRGGLDMKSRLLKLERAQIE